MRFGKKRQLLRNLFNGWETESEMVRDGKRKSIIGYHIVISFLLIYNLSLLNVKFIDKK